MPLITFQWEAGEEGKGWGGGQYDLNNNTTTAVLQSVLHFLVVFQMMHKKRVFKLHAFVYKYASFVKAEDTTLQNSFGFGTYLVTLLNYYATELVAWFSQKPNCYFLKKNHNNDTDNNNNIYNNSNIIVINNFRNRNNPLVSVQLYLVMPFLSPWIE